MSILNLSNYFGLSKVNSNGLKATTLEIENKDLLFISYDPKIPNVDAGLSIVIRLDENGHLQVEKSINQIPDPSTIYVNLPIRDEQNFDKLPYWPHYIRLSPEQRFNYLKWLRNIDEPTDMGFVFLYYYGLERQLLDGNFDKAFDQIIRLRNVHLNKSFLSYSEQALIHACLLKNKIEKLFELHLKTQISGFSNAQFLFAYNLKLDLSAQNLIQIFYKTYTLSRKAIKENRKLFEECVADVLLNKFDRESFPIKDYNIEKTRKIIEMRFANYSFPQELQKVEITDFYQCKPIMTDIEVIFNESYEKFKEKISVQRKLQKSNKTIDEIKSDNLKKIMNRYKKLHLDKKITQDEFDLLTKSLK